MKHIRNLGALFFVGSVVSCASLGQIVEDVWEVGTPYSDQAKTTWDSSDRLSRLQYEIVYLMDADVAAREITKDGSTVDNLPEVLTSLLESAALELKKHPNPRLSKMILYHDSQYNTGDGFESWSESIGIIKSSSIQTNSN